VADAVKTKIKFGLIAGGTMFPAWLANSIRSLLDLGFTEPSLIINKTVSYPNTWLKNSSKKSVKDLSAAKLIRNYPSFHLLSKIDKRLWRPIAWNNISLAEELSSVPQIKCNVGVKNRFIQYFNDEDIKKISSYNLDFILYCDYSILHGEILNAAKYGVWSFHHDDEQKYRGSSSGIWEIYNNDKINGVILQRLTKKLDAGIVLSKKYFSTINYSLSLNYDQLLFGSADMPAEVCRELFNDPDFSNRFVLSKSEADIYKFPTNLQTFKLAFILLKNFLLRSPLKITADSKIIIKNI
jgi:hypothetical protein